jgi:hypothetical protein
VVVLVKLPEAPVTVTVTVPVVAVPLAVSVKVLELAGLVVLVGLNEAVTPAGNTEETDKLTLPVKPFCGVTEMVLPPLAPCTIDRAFGEAESEKLGTAAAVTVSETVVVCVNMPEVPVMVTLTVPVVAVLLAVSVKVLEFAGLVVLVGLKEGVTPAGNTEETDKLTLPVKPFCGVTEMVLPPLAPCTIDKVFGEAEREKLGTGAAITLRLTVVVLVKLPEVPLMVTVAVPVVAVLPAVSVKVLEFAGLLVLVGLKDAATPLGKPDADKATLPLKPFSEPTEMVLEPLAPCITLKVFGDVESVKLGDVLVMTATLSKVAVARLEVFPLLTARPMYAFWPMVIV